MQQIFLIVIVKRLRHFSVKEIFWVRFPITKKCALKFALLAQLASSTWLLIRGVLGSSPRERTSGFFRYIIWRLWHGASAYLSQYSQNMVRVQQTPLNSNINSIVGRSYSLGAVSLWIWDWLVMQMWEPYLTNLVLAHGRNSSRLPF